MGIMSDGVLKGGPSGGVTMQLSVGVAVGETGNCIGSMEIPAGGEFWGR